MSNVTIDPELGPVLLCPACHEEWPFDDDFWHMRDGKLSRAWPARCIACCAEYYASKRRLIQNIERAERVQVLPPSADRCGHRMPRSRSYCGRKKGHGFQHRSMEAMDYEATKKTTARRMAA